GGGGRKRVLGGRISGSMTVVKTRTLGLWFRQKWFVRLLQPTNQRPVPFGHGASSRSMARRPAPVPGSPLPPPPPPRRRGRLNHFRYEAYHPVQPHQRRLGWWGREGVHSVR